jgi:hypothetical protein
MRAFGAIHQRATTPDRALSPQISRCRPSCQISPSRHRRRGVLHHDIISRIIRLFRVQAVNQAVDLGNREPRDLQAEVEIEVLQSLKLLRQQILVPAGIERQLVVGQHIGAFLVGRHVLQPDAGHAVQAPAISPLQPGHVRQGSRYPGRSGPGS